LGLIGGMTAAFIAIGAPAPAVVVTTQNVRYTLGPAHTRHDIRHAAAGGSVVLAQEFRYRHAARYRPAGWGAVQASRPRVLNRGDCAVYWDRAVWRLRRAYVVPVTDYPARNGHRRALVAVLTGRHTLAAVCVHMPTHKVPRPAYWRGIGRLRVAVERLAARYRHVIVGGDWNNPYSTRARFPGFATVAPGIGTGARGGRVDYLYVSRPDSITGHKVITGTYSDHNGMRVRDKLAG